MKKKSEVLKVSFFCSLLTCSPCLLYATTGQAMTNVTVKTEVMKAVAGNKKKITGKVVDRNGQPVIGASIIQKGSSNGTVSDLDGKFSLEVSEASTLTISYVGFKTQTISVEGKSNVVIELQDDMNTLNDVVVIGYGSARKSDISGSVSSIDKELMRKRHPINLNLALQGAAAGVMVSKNSGDPEGGASVRIRGVATVNGSADPLYVVDGVQVGTDANFVNPSDIESVEILKDASATAIYGARGANGVILITTKKGEMGATKVDFSVNYGIQSLTGKLDVADADLFAYSVRQSRANDGATITNPAFGADYTGKLRTIDWQKAMTRTALQQNYNLSISKGNENGQSNFSIGYLNNDGIVKRSNFSRLTAHANATYKVKNFFEFNGNLSFVHTEKKGSGGNLRDWATLTPTMDYVDSNGTFISHDYDETYGDGKYYAFMQTSGNADITKDQDNIYAALMDADSHPERTNRVLASASIKLNLFKGLKFNTTGSYNYYADDYGNFKRTKYRTSYDAINQLSLSQSNSNDVELESFFTYNWKDKINNLTIMAGNTISNKTGYWISASAKNFLSEEYRKLSLTSDPTSYTCDGGYNLKTRYLSWYGRMMYSLMDRYILTATVRRDGSSNFGKSNRWGTFPSVAAAWRISEEKFMKDVPYISNMKLRFGWGQTGNAGDPTSLAITQLSNDRVAYCWGS